MDHPKFIVSNQNDILGLITTSFNVNPRIYVLCVNSYFTEGHKVD